MRKKPNFIIIYCDDLGYGDLGCYGSDIAKTPNIDQLAAEGMRFSNWYSNSPVCSPSRASLLTGQYPAKTGVNKILIGKRGTKGISKGVATLPEMLKKQGYTTGVFGKWHLGSVAENTPNSQGFDEFFGFHAGCVDYYSHIFYWAQASGVNPIHDLWHNRKEVWSDGQYMTELITEKSIEFIEQRKDEPFFTYVSYNAPHYPMHAPKKYLDRFPGLPWDKRIMAAMISAIDDGVGEIVQKLKDVGIFEDTVIFFSSDNGPSSESRNWLDGTEDFYYGGDAGKFRGHKGSLFEGGIREPAILINIPKLPSGETNSKLCMMADVVPTFLDLTGVNSDSIPQLDGKSLVKMITENTPSPHDELFWEYNGQIAVRKGDWKLILDGMLDMTRKHTETIHLSNLATDIGERKNVAEVYPELTRELKANAQNWYEALYKKSDVKSES